MNLRISTSDAIAIGDGANDLPMIKHAGMGIAFCAKAKVKAEAKYAINQPNLKAVLYAQGYNDSEIVE